MTSLFMGNWDFLRLSLDCDAHTGSPSLIVTTRILKKSELLLRIKLYLENKNTLSRVRGKLWFDEKENITMNENELIKIDDNKL